MRGTLHVDSSRTAETIAVRALDRTAPAYLSCSSYSSHVENTTWLRSEIVGSTTMNLDYTCQRVVRPVICAMQRLKDVHTNI